MKNSFKDFMIKRGTTVEIEVYGAITAETVTVSLPHDRYYRTEQWTDDFEEGGERFYVFSVAARHVPSIPCGLGIVVNSKDVIRLTDKTLKNSAGEI